jgi:hypothetical protein
MKFDQHQIGNDMLSISQPPSALRSWLISIAEAAAFTVCIFAWAGFAILATLSDLHFT